MTLKYCAASILFLSLAVAKVEARGMENTQNIAIDSDLQIPGDVLKSGTYTLKLEERIADRVIVRISSVNTAQHYLLLAVPSRRLGKESGKGIVLFTSADGRKQILQGWVCPSCAEGLEFVYSKLEAVKITDETGQRVFAVDASYDKLGEHLTVSDMKRATIWSLSAERVKAKHGLGVKAVKYAEGIKPKLAAPRVIVAQARVRRLPKTATNTGLLMMLGTALCIAALGLHAKQRIEVRA
jgi:hypothetical protein